MNGYAIRLYKREANSSGRAIIDGSMFMTWMNFDCMDVIGIHEFQNYNKAMDVNDVKGREIYCARQKFFIYSLDGERESSCPNVGQEDLLFNGVQLQEFPIITMTMLDIQLDNQCPEENPDAFCQKVLHGVIEDVTGASASIKGQLYGSLSAYDYVMVFRGNDYLVIDNILADCREKMSQSGILLNKMYTIAGIDYKNAAAWRTNGLKVSIRLSCKPSITARLLANNQQLADALSDMEVNSILGKYDFDIIGTINSPEKFVNLFLNDGILSAKWDGIHKTNTRFLNVKEVGIEDKEDLRKEWNEGREFSRIDEPDKIFESIYEVYKRIELSQSLKEILLRLVLRTFQALIATNHKEMSHHMQKKLCDFLDFLDKSQKDAHRLNLSQNQLQDEYANMINTFNVMLDNRIMVGISDFETPRKVLRYSGSSMKVLMAYSSFVEHLMKILAHNKNRENKIVNGKNVLKYLDFVTAEPSTRLKAVVSLLFSDQYRFINISIPIDLMFEVAYVQAWITHEVGHFIRAGWNRKTRNAAYYSSVCREMVKLLMPYRNLRYEELIMDIMGEAHTEHGTKIRAVPDERGWKFDEYRNCLNDYFKAVVCRYSFDCTQEFYIPYNKVEEFYSNIEEFTFGLQTIYEEAIADMFMLQVLGIQQLNEYLRIQAAYCSRIGMDMENLSQIHIARIAAVSVVLAELDACDYSGIYNYFLAVYNVCTDDGIALLVKKLKEYTDYYFLEPLIDFLAGHVKVGLAELLREDEIADSTQKIKQNYSNVRRGGFHQYMGFVLSFCADYPL